MLSSFFSFKDNDFISFVFTLLVPFYASKGKYTYFSSNIKAYLDVLFYTLNFFFFFLQNHRESSSRFPHSNFLTAAKYFVGLQVIKFSIDGLSCYFQYCALTNSSSWIILYICHFTCTQVCL